MTKITFEAATLGDAIAKAARVAPTKSGDAFDKSWGILLVINPGEEVKCIVRATNLDIFYTEAVTCLSAEGEATSWRLPSQLLGSVMSAIPPSSGRIIELVQDGSKIKISSGKLKSVIVMGDADQFEHWDLFDSVKMTEISNFAAKIMQVEWAASNNRIAPNCGVHLTGEHLIATDGYVMCRIPCKVDLPKPVTFPPSVLGTILKTMGDTSLALEGTMLFLQPDDWTQIKVITYDMPYLPVEVVMNREYPRKIIVSKTHLLHLINSAANFASSDRSANIKIYLGETELAVFMKNQEAGHLGDILDCPEADHKRVLITFNPQMLTSALSKCPSDDVLVSYDPNKLTTPVHFKSGTFEAWISPLKNLPTV